ncbi:hypothetical protein ASE91_09245 [Sphingomonas sp. Leaf62]|nr:hypothetical protein ASE91_09245 [Sphingomonas sp. Leaf62]
MRGRPPDGRRHARQTRAGPLLDAFRQWLDATGPKLSRRSDLAVAIRDALTRWTALTRYADDGRFEMRPSCSACSTMSPGRIQVATVLADR